MHLCDAYANYKTACCWPSNETLAKNLEADVRSVQRWMQELREGGWAQRVKLNGRRRAIQLTFPQQRERDTEHDRQGDSGPTNMSSEHDRHVAPYKEPKKNLRNDCAGPGHKRSFNCLVIRDGEPQYLDAWKTWISEQTGLCPDSALASVRTLSGHYLPSRYPSSDPNAQQHYEAYFEEAMKTRGRMFRR